MPPDLADHATRSTVLPPLRFCMITTFYPPYSFGGDAIYVHRLCSELVKRDHVVHVIHCADSYHLFRHKVTHGAFPASPGIEQHKLRSSFGALSPLLSHQTGFPMLKRGAIRKVLNSEEFDVIHFHNISLFGPAVLRIRPKYPVIKLFTMHDHWLVCPTNVLWKNGDLACDKPTCVRCSIRSKRPPQLWRRSGLLEDAAKHVDCFLAPSRFCRDMHARRGFHGNMDVLPEFVSLDQDAADAPVERMHERPYFLFVGRLEKLKGVQELLPLFENDGPYDLLVLGAGTYEQTLREQAKRSRRIRFVGWVGQEELHRYYRGALGVVVPSLTYETFGIVSIEAMAHRVPVIVNNLGALPEVVAETGGGLIYNTRDELAEQIERLWQNAALREELGRRGFEAVKEKYTADIHLRQYIGLLKHLQHEQWRRAQRLAETE